MVLVTAVNSHNAVHIARREAERSGTPVRIVKFCGVSTARALLQEQRRAGGVATPHAPIPPRPARVYTRGERASMRLNQVTVGATDLPASIAFYRALGFTLIVRSEHYARFIVPDGEGTFSLHVTPSVPRDGAPVVYFECDDLDARYARLRDAGIVFDLPPTDQPWTLKR